MRFRNTAFKSLTLAFVFLFLGCNQKKVEQTQEPAPSPEPAQSPPKYLYVATGLCYSGNGLTTFTATTASNLVLKINTETGQRESIVADYNAAPASGGDTPVGVVNWNSDNLLVLIANGTSGRIEIVPKVGGNRSNFGLNPSPGTILATAPRGMLKTSDGGLLIMRTGFIERVNSSGVRQGTPWVSNNLGATCGTSNTFYTSVITTASTSNRIVATHAAASPNNRIVSVPATGASGSCSAAQASPQTTTYPVASAFDHSNGKVLIAYGGVATTTDINSIFVYDFDESTGALSNPQKIYDASLSPATYSYLLYGISAMTLDEGTKTLYVATAMSTGTPVSNYVIEKLAYDATQIGTNNTGVLTRSGTVPFYNYGVDTKCISQMVIGD